MMIRLFSLYLRVSSGSVRHDLVFFLQALLISLLFLTGSTPLLRGAERIRLIKESLPGWEHILLVSEPQYQSNLSGSTAEEGPVTRILSVEPSIATWLQTGLFASELDSGARILCCELSGPAVSLLYPRLKDAIEKGDVSEEYPALVSRSLAAAVPDGSAVFVSSYDGKYRASLTIKGTFQSPFLLSLRGFTKQPLISSAFLFIEDEPDFGGSILFFAARERSVYCVRSSALLYIREEEDPARVRDRLQLQFSDLNFELLSTVFLNEREEQRREGRFPLFMVMIAGISFLFHLTAYLILDRRTELLHQETLRLYGMARRDLSFLTLIRRFLVLIPAFISGYWLSIPLGQTFSGQYHRPASAAALIGALVLFLLPLGEALAALFRLHKKESL